MSASASEPSSSRGTSSPRSTASLGAGTKVSGGASCPAEGLSHAALLAHPQAGGRELLAHVTLTDQAPHDVEQGVADVVGLDRACCGVRDLLTLDLEGAELGMGEFMVGDVDVALAQ